MRNLYLALLLIALTLLVISCSEEQPKEEKSNIPSAGAKTVGDQSWKKHRLEYMEKCRLKEIRKDEEAGGYTCIYQGQKHEENDVFVGVGHHSMCVKVIYCGRK